MEQAIGDYLPYILMAGIVLMSITIHEFSHGLVAYFMGDTTAKEMGRLSLNPFRHLDLFGSILLPAFLLLARSPFMIAWAKPVPVHPTAMKNPTLGAVLSSLAGPASNILIAVVAALVLKAVYPMYPPTNLLIIALFECIVLNLVLAIFNLVPIPPLDGSRIWSSFLPPSVQYSLEQFAPLFIILIVFLFNDQIGIAIARVTFYFFSFFGLPTQGLL